MGKFRPIVGLLVLVTAMAIQPRLDTHVVAQTVTPAPLCPAGASTAPMPGHYTGPWHSTGDYHFAVFGTDLDLKIAIDGTVDATVDAGGRLMGTVSGAVDAPITDYGRHDVSSGTGTMSGNLSGVLSGSSSLIVLSHPVIAMRWGTFDGTHTVDRSVTMPDYSFTPGTVGCVNLSGSISETGFPTMIVTSDGTGQITQAPGVGAAGGTWELHSDQATRFDDLSRQIDSVFGAASLILDASRRFDPAAFRRQVSIPLDALVEAIRADPAVARCLLARIAAWEGETMRTEEQRVAALDLTTLPALRQARDSIRAMHSLDPSCAPAGGVAESAARTAAIGMLDRAITTRMWTDVALLARELVVLDSAGGQAAAQDHLTTGLHSLLSTTTGTSDLLELARVTYALGDDADARIAYHRLTTLARPFASRWFQRKHKHKPSHHPALPWHPSKPSAPPRPKPKPNPTATVSTNPKPKPILTPSATATARPSPTPSPAALPTLLQVLAGSLAPMTTGISGYAPVFRWSPVSGARHYLVTVVGGSPSRLQWSWSGTATSVSFGDTTVSDDSGIAPAWPLTIPGTYRWSVLAFDATGQIVGVGFSA